MEYGAKVIQSYVVDGSSNLSLLQQLVIIIIIMTIAFCCCLSGLVTLAEKMAVGYLANVHNCASCNVCSNIT